ncbi:hypothetical protein NQ318_007020 [Aromia moschata]|uniref:CHK kinase-like domain-containing protein n=1 Tax=Aromia moschata TaxID=1265417 RepID=A0AAV8Y2R3_9CUCU|nr:hypothetical protein NQ318_007020 [Aromia moschata]
MNVETIPKLDEVLRLQPSRSVADCKTTRLTAPGENYGSLMLRLEVKVVDEDSKSEENLDLVAKLLPPSKMMQEMFNVQTTFGNETGFYRDIVPVLEEFQRQHGLKVVNIFPKYYGSRISLDANCDKVDDGAVLILENLKPSGFTTANRTVGFDLQSSRFLAKHLAYFHAISLALKLKNPGLFEQKVRPYLSDFRFGEHRNFDDFPPKLFNILKENHTCVPFFDIIEKLIKQKSSVVIHEPFATMLHNDFWVNNVLLKFENGIPVEVKIVDFQVIEYRSPCRDLLFFLFSSVQLKVLEEHLDRLIDCYYESFVEKLKEFKCDVEPFSREAFDKQLELAAKEAEYFHIVAMLFPIHIDSSSVKDATEISPEDMAKGGHVTRACKDKLIFTTVEFIKRGWMC